MLLPPCDQMGALLLEFSTYQLRNFGKSCSETLLHFPLPIEEKHSYVSTEIALHNELLYTSFYFVLVNVIDHVLTTNLRPKTFLYSKLIILP